MENFFVMDICDILIFLVILVLMKWIFCYCCLVINFHHSCMFSMSLCVSECFRTQVHFIQQFRCLSFMVLCNLEESCFVGLIGLTSITFCCFLIFCHGIAKGRDC